MSVSGMPSSTAPRLVYLCGPLAEEDADSAITWRAFVSLRLAQQGVASYNPYLAFRSLHQAGEQGLRINEAAIGYCDVVIVNLLHVPITAAVARDVGFARASSKPVIIVHSLDDDTVEQLDELTARDCDVVPTLEAALYTLLAKPTTFQWAESPAPVSVHRQLASLS